MHRLIFLGMAAGVAAGIGLWYAPADAAWANGVIWLCDLIGKTMFIGALKMLVAPLIFASIVAGITSLPSSRELGSLGWRTLAFYATTTSIAVFIGLVMVNIIRPGEWDASKQIRESRLEKIRAIESQVRAEVDTAGVMNRAKTSVNEDEIQQRVRAAIAAEEGSGLTMDSTTLARYERVKETERSPVDFVLDLLESMIQNPIHALATNSSLGIIFFAILMGLACISVGEAAQPVVKFFRGLNAVIIRLTVWIMQLSPVAVFCLMASLISDNGPQVFASLAGYVVTVIAGIAVHVGVLLTICATVGGCSVPRFLSGIREAWLIAFSTRSSAATLPVTISAVEKNLKVPPKVSEFVLPIGATVNMDGTALYEGVAVIFLLQMFADMPDVGITLAFAPMVLIFITAVLASVGAAAVPDAGLITMVLVANAVGLPEYYLVFIFSVDAFLDMFRTSTNVMGDAVGSVVLARITPLLPPSADTATGGPS